MIINLAKPVSTFAFAKKILRSPPRPPPPPLLPYVQIFRCANFCSVGGRVGEPLGNNLSIS